MDYIAIKNFRYMQNNFNLCPGNDIDGRQDHLVLC